MIVVGPLLPSIWRAPFCTETVALAPDFSDETPTKWVAFTALVGLSAAKAGSTCTDTRANARTGARRRVRFEVITPDHSMSGSRRLKSFPAPAEHLVQLHHRQRFVQVNLRERQFRLKEIAVGVKRVQLGVHAALIANVGEPFAVFERFHQRFLMLAALAYALMRDQSVGYFAERRLNRLLIVDQRAFALRLGEFYVLPQAARRENRLRNIGNERPGAMGTRE